MSQRWQIDVDMASAEMVAFGALTAIGLSSWSTAAALRAGVSGGRRHPFFVDRQGDHVVLASIAMLDDVLDPVLRFRYLGEAAALQAIDASTSAGVAGDRVALVLSLPAERPGFSAAERSAVRDALVDVCRRRLNLDGSHVIADDHAGSIIAFDLALQLIESARADVVICGGVDSYIVPDTIEWLDANEQIHGPGETWGFTPGEAAAFCVLRGATREGGLLTIGGTGVAHEPNRIRTDTVCIGNGMADAWRRACAGAALGGREVGLLIGDLNGDPYRGTEFGFAKLRTKKFLVDGADIVTPADCWGDVGAASGPLFAITHAIAVQKNYAAHPCALAFCGSDGGTRAALVMSGAAGTRHTTGRL